MCCSPRSRHVAVAAAVDEEVAVGDDGRAGDRRVLPVGRRDRRDAPERKSVRAETRRAVERHRGTEDVGLDRRQRIEERRVPHAFATSRMTDDEDPVEVDLAVQRMGRRAVPRAELLHVLEMHDPARVVLAEVAAVQEVHVDRGRDDALRREQRAQVQIARRRIRQRTVIAVREHGERERPTSARDADMPVERHARVREGPRGADAQVGEHRDVDPRRDAGGVRRVVDRVLGQRRHAPVVAARRGVDHRVERKAAWKPRIGQRCHGHSFAQTVLRTVRVRDRSLV